MNVNPDKFQVILLDKRGSDKTNTEVYIDHKLNFNHHVSKLCK